MTLQELMKMWSEDSSIDKLDVAGESVRTANLHAKYAAIQSTQRLILLKKQYELNRLELLKYEYYSGELDKDTLKEQGWEPNRKIILKTNIEKYMDADPQIIKAKLEVGMYKEIIAFLKEVFQHINQRTFLLKSIMDERRFNAGY